jgi:uncharacterized protein
MKKSTTSYNIAFIGCGPSNLFGSVNLKENNPDANFIIIDSGKIPSERDHNDSIDIVNGVGGAGLFSDGKFSFYPSGTEIWNYDKSNIMKSYGIYKDILSMFTKEIIPDFPEELLHNNPESKNEWTEKTYPVLFLTLNERKLLINYLYNVIRYNLMSQTTVINIEKLDNNMYDLTCIDKNNIISNIFTNNIVFGGGRFMPFFTKQFSFIQHEFKRIEVGIRVEGPSDCHLYNVSNSMDPKFIKNTDICESRTFCWCREGDTTCTSFAHYDKNNIKTNIYTWSGRSDVGITNKSNFGFNIRFKDEKYIEMINDAIRTEPFSIDYDDNDNVPEKYAGIWELIKMNLDDFLLINGVNTYHLKIKGPTIEGIGYYPKTDENMKVVNNENIWVGGDANGKFRGITASVLSGIFISNLFI